LISTFFIVFLRPISTVSDKKRVHQVVKTAACNKVIFAAF